MAAAVAEVAAELEAEAAVACRDHLAAAGCHGHLEVAVFRDLPEVLRRVHRPARGHRSAVRPHSIVPAAELRARQVLPRAPVWVPGAGHDRQFNPEPDRAQVPVRDWQVVQASDPDHRLCLRLVQEPARDPGRALDLDHRLCRPFVLAQDWQLERG